MLRVKRGIWRKNMRGSSLPFFSRFYHEELARSLSLTTDLLQRLIRDSEHQKVIQFPPYDYLFSFRVSFLGLKSHWWCLTGFCPNSYWEATATSYPSCSVEKDIETWSSMMMSIYSRKVNWDVKKRTKLRGYTSLSRGTHCHLFRSSICRQVNYRASFLESKRNLRWQTY